MDPFETHRRSVVDHVTFSFGFIAIRNTRIPQYVAERAEADDQWPDMYFSLNFNCAPSGGAGELFRHELLRSRVRSDLPGEYGACCRQFRPTNRAAELAEIVLSVMASDRACGLTADNGVRVTVLRVFEYFVTAALGGHLVVANFGTARPQYPFHVNIEGRGPMRPDFVWERGGRAIGVVDAKYRRSGGRERVLLVVAFTRAREELSISWHCRPSPLLTLEHST
jgi:hypothetical protein